MIYTAVNNLCALDLSQMDMKISHIEAINILIMHGFQICHPQSLIDIARSRINISEYQMCIHPNQAPHKVDCSSFMMWIYAHRGILLPRLTIQQRRYGIEIPIQKRMMNDLVFTTGIKNWIDIEADDNIGHVGILTAQNTVIHASFQSKTVVETPLQQFCNEKTFRGIRRYIPSNYPILTIKVPTEKYIHSSEDFNYLFIKGLKKKKGVSLRPPHYLLSS